MRLGEWAAKRSLARLKGIANAGAWTLGSNAVGSASNVLVTVSSARVLTPEDFGVVAVGLAVWMVVTGGLRAYCGEPLLIELASATADEARRRIPIGLGFAVTVGSALGAAVLLTGILLGGDWRDPFLVLGLLLPFLTLQDAGRYALFGLGRSSDAFKLDFAWLAVQGAALALITAVDLRSPAWSFASWSAGGVFASLFGLRWLGLVPSVSHLGEWLRSQRILGKLLLWEFAVAQGAAFVAVAGLSFFDSRESSGALRGAMVLFGPLLIVTAAATALFVPTLSRLATKGEFVQLRRRVRSISLGLSLLACTYSGLLILIPDSFGSEALGRTWAISNGLIPILGAAQVLSTFAAGRLIGLRSMRAASSSLRARVIVFPFSLLLVMGGVTMGKEGAGWAVMASAALTALAFYRAFENAIDARLSCNRTSA